MKNTQKTDFIILGKNALCGCDRREVDIMRDIIFRGKTVCDGDWVYGGITWNPSRKKFFIHTDWEEAKVIPETVGQYTGLTDKNGTKIFEGDIIGAEDVTFEIRWRGYVSCFTIYKKDVPYPLAPVEKGIVRNYEVIGNIYDNPELLESDIHKAETAESE
jgi:hypothetical protein